MEDKKFLLTAKGEGFELTQQGSGDLDAAKAAYAAATGLEVDGYYVGDVDMSGH